MTNLHLCLICGRDNRYHYIRHTVLQSLPVFDTIHVMDTGSTDETGEVAKYSSRVNYFKWDDWELGWGNAYDSVRRDVPDDAWFLYLDSDEMPSQYMLDHIRDAVGRIESEGYGQARIPNVLHMDGKRAGSPAYDLPRTPEEFQRNGCWTKSIICRNDRSLETRDFGMHASYTHTTRSTAYLPLYYTHHKYEEQLDAAISICSFQLPESYGVSVERNEHAVLNQLTQRFDIRNPNQLVDLLQTDPPDEFLAALDLWEHSDLETCRHWYRWYRNGFTVGGYPLQLCDETCCHYRELHDSGTVTPGSVARLKPGWRVESGTDGYFVRYPGRRAPLQCNDVAAAVLQQIGHRRTVAEISHNFIQAFPEAVGQIGGDTIAVLEELAAQDVVALETPVAYVRREVARDIETAVASETAPWRRRGGWNPDAPRRAARDRRWILASFHGDSVVVDWHGNEAGRCTPLGPYLQRIAMESGRIRGDFAINPHDGVAGDPEFPALGFSKPMNDPEHPVLIPDIYFIEGYSSIRARILDTTGRVRWDDKLPWAIWRGTPTGVGENTPENWRDNTRVKVCLTSLKQPELINARLSGFVQSTPAAESRMLQAGILGDYLPEHKQLFYKFILNVDGNSSAWGGTFWKLLSNSLMIQVRSGSGWCQWYHHWLEEGRHYLACDLEDLTGLIGWARDNDETCRRIADHATNLVKDYLTDEAGRTYTRLVLEALTDINRRN